MNKHRIAILTDSGTDTPHDVAEAFDIRSVALRINYSDGSSYRSGIDISADELIERFDEEIPTTSLPSPDAIRMAIESAREDGYESAIFITISSGLSATYETVHLVASSFAPDFPITCIDTRSIGIAAGMCVIEAARAADRGLTHEECVQHVRGLVPNTRVFFSMDKLDFLYKGGRIGKGVYRIGSILNIKPVMTCSPEGTYVISNKARGFDRAQEQQVKLIEQFAALYKRVRVAICSYNNAAFEQFAERQLRERISNITEIIVTTLSPDLLVHTGSSLVGIAVQGENDG